MPTFEVAIQSDAGSIGPFEVEADTVETAILVARRVAEEFLTGRLSGNLLQRQWAIVIRDAAGRVVATSPAHVLARAAQAQPDQED